MSSGIAELWELFAEEAAASFEELEALLLELEKDPAQPDKVDALYRALHTLKGSGRVMGVATVDAVGHAAEELAELARAGRPLSSAHVDLFLEATDALRRAVDEAVATQGGGELKAYRELIQRLEAGKDLEPEAAEAPAASPTPAPVVEPVERFPADLAEVERVEPSSDPEFVAAFLELAAERLGPISQFLEPAVQGDPDAREGLYEELESLRFGVQHMGYVALEGALDRLEVAATSGEASAAREAERVLVRELVRIQETVEESSDSDQPLSTIADLYGEWHLGRAYEDLARLSELVDGWAMRSGSSEGEMAELLSRLHRTASYCGLERGRDLAAVLSDAFARAALGEVQLDELLVDRLRDFGSSLGSALDLPDQDAIFDDLTEEVQAQLAGSGKPEDLGWLGTHDPLSAAAVREVRAAQSRGERFFKVWMDLEEDAEAAEAFYSWLQSVRLITSETGDPGFEFVVTSASSVVEVERELAGVDPVGRRLRATLLEPSTGSSAGPVLVEEPPAPLAPEPVEVPAPAALDPVQPVQPPPAPQPVEAAPEAASPQAGRYLRVQADKVSELLDLAGEIGLAVGALLSHPRLQGEELDGLSHRLESLVQELQGSSASLRLVAVSSVFNRMARVVRDLGRECGKSVRLEIVGGDVELDKVVVDGLYEPLLHMIRNAIDHGVESPEERLRAGKPEQAVITLSAAQRGGEIHVSVQDDGRGLDRHAILAKARERGLLGPGEEAANDQQVWSYILRPGFSTAKTVSALSGRGVGMDVVDNAARRMRGRMSIQSVPGRGTAVGITVPLTLAFMDGLAVRVDEHLYLIPDDVVREVALVDSGRVTHDAALGRRVFPHQGELVTLRSLPEFYGQDRAELPARTLCTVVSCAEGLLAIPVDEVLGYVKATMKPLPQHLEGVRAVVGVGVLRSGDLALALDCEKLVHAA